jgi:hypothetical protein
VRSGDSDDSWEKGLAVASVCRTEATTGGVIELRIGSDLDSGERLETKSLMAMMKETATRQTSHTDISRSLRPNTNAQSHCILPARHKHLFKLHKEGAGHNLEVSSMALELHGRACGAD